MKLILIVTIISLLIIGAKSDDPSSDVPPISASSDVPPISASAAASKNPSRTNKKFVFQAKRSPPTNGVFVYNKRLLSNNTRIGRDFTGSERYGTFTYSGTCPTTDGPLDGITIQQASATGGTCFTDQSTGTAPTIGYICEPGSPSTIHFGYPGTSGFIIGGSNFVATGTAQNGFKWGTIGTPTYDSSSASCTASCDASCTASFCDPTCTATCASAPSCTATDPSPTCADNAVGTGSGGTTYFVPTGVTPTNCGSGAGSCCSTFSFPQPSFFTQPGSTDCGNPSSVYSSSCDPSLNVDPISGACYSGQLDAYAFNKGFILGQVLPQVKMNSFTFVAWVCTQTPVTSVDWSVSTTCDGPISKCNSVGAVPVCDYIGISSYGYSLYGCTVQASCDMTSGGPYYLLLSNGVADGNGIFNDQISSTQSCSYENGNGYDCYPTPTTSFKIN